MTPETTAATKAVDTASDRFFPHNVLDVDLDAIEAEVRADTLAKATISVNCRLPLDLEGNIRLLALRRGKSKTALVKELIVLGYKVFIRKELRDAALKEDARRQLTREEITPPAPFDPSLGRTLTADDIPDEPARPIDEEVAPGPTPPQAPNERTQPAPRVQPQPAQRVGRTAEQREPPRISPRSERMDRADLNLNDEFED